MSLKFDSEKNPEFLQGFYFIEYLQINSGSIQA
jgi:hypothetical protein